MATHSSAEKRHRQSIKRRDSNRYAKSTLRTSMKKATELASEGKREEALEEARVANSLLDKAIVHGVMHKNTARRTISRLHKRISANLETAS